MPQLDLAPVPATIESDWNEERGRSFVETRLAALALEASNELDIESELSLVA